jgi:hypothetical protein
MARKERERGAIAMSLSKQQSLHIKTVHHGVLGEVLGIGNIVRAHTIG